jgi:hypothetical protein
VSEHVHETRLLNKYWKGRTRQDRRVYWSHEAGLVACDFCLDLYVVTGISEDCTASRDIIRQIKSRRMRWAEHVERMGQGRNVYRFSVESPKEKTT